jgi:hypothetical protein
MNRRSFFSNLFAAAVAPLFTSKAEAPPVVATCPSCGRADCRHANLKLCEIDQQYRHWNTCWPAPFLVVQTLMSREEFSRRYPPLSPHANVTAEAPSSELATRTVRRAGWTYPALRSFHFGDFNRHDIVRVVEIWPAARAPFVLLRSEALHACFTPAGPAKCID